MKEIKFSIDSYEEHRHEFFDRLQQGLLPADITARAQDLKEDLEVLQTELELNDARIVQEKGHMSKLLKKDGSAQPDAFLSRLNAIRGFQEGGGNDGNRMSALEEAIGGIFFDEIKQFQQQIQTSSRSAGSSSSSSSSSSVAAVVSDYSLRQLIEMLMVSTFSSRQADSAIKMLTQQLDDKQVYDHRLR